MRNDSSDDQKRAAALAALAEIQDGMIVGLGTGSTAAHFIEALGAKARSGFKVTCVPTSEASEGLARAAGLTLAPLDGAKIDVTVDGADESDAALNLIKGGGGALLREKMVANASGGMIVIADASKRVHALGRFPLPVEILQFGHRTTMAAIARAAAAQGCRGNLTHLRGGEAHPFITDNGNFIADMDCQFIPDPAGLAAALDAIPGVVGHGLFIGLCRRAYFGHAGGVDEVSV